MPKRLFNNHGVKPEILEALGKIVLDGEFEDSLSVLLPKAYSWKQKPQREKVNIIIEKATKSNLPTAEYNAKFKSTLKVIQNQLFNREFKSKLPKTFRISPRQAKQYAKILEKATEVPLVDSIGKDIKKKLKLFADIYRAHSSGWLAKKMSLTKKPVDVNYLVKSKMIIRLYRYFESLVITNKFNKEYNGQHPKTESFLVRMVKQTLPKPYMVNENQIRQIILKKS